MANDQPAKEGEGDLNTIDQSQQTRTFNNADRVKTLMSTLIPIQNSIDNIAETKAKYQCLLYEPTFLFRYRKDWIAFLVAFRIYNSYQNGQQPTAEQLRTQIENIRKYDKILANDVEKTLPIAEDKTGLFRELREEYKKGKEYFVAYIVTHIDQLKAKANTLANTKLKQRIIELFSSISGHEAESLLKYEADCEEWINIATHGYGIAFFIQRINLFLNGGKVGNLEFNGLYTSFKDTGIGQTMLQNNSVRNLWFYKEQVNYLNRLIGICINAQADESWKGFFGPKGFWTDFEKYAGAFEKGYGNVDFAGRLVATKKETKNERPRDWSGVWQPVNEQKARELAEKGTLSLTLNGRIYVLVEDGILTKLLRELMDRRYQVNKIVHPAASALLRIFEDRRNKLNASRDEYLMELLKLIEPTERVEVIKLLRLLRKRRKGLLKDLRKDMDEFIGAIINPFLQYSELLQELSGAIKKMDFAYIDQETGKLTTAAQNYAKYLNQQVRRNRFLNDFTEFLRVNAFDAAKSEAKFRSWQIETFNHLNEEDFENLRRIIKLTWALLVEMKKVYAYLLSKLTENYEINEQIMAGLNNPNIKNKKFTYSYVDRLTKRLL